MNLITNRIFLYLMGGLGVVLGLYIGSLHWKISGLEKDVLEYKVKISTYKEDIVKYNNKIAKFVSTENTMAVDRVLRSTTTINSIVNENIDNLVNAAYDDYRDDNKTIIDEPILDYVVPYGEAEVLMEPYTEHLKPKNNDRKRSNRNIQTIWNVYNKTLRYTK